MEDATHYFLMAVGVLMAFLTAAVAIAWFRRHK